MTLTLEEIPTPALVVDVDLLDQNLALMETATTCALRPHVKAHKCRQIAERQLERGAIGLTVATVSEAEAFADLGAVLVANEVVEASKVARLVAVAERTDLMVAVDSVECVAALAGTGLAVLVDVNVGLPRCGVAPEAALDLARTAESAGLRVRGVMGYEGHVMAEPDPASRRASAGASMKILLDVTADLRSNGFECEVVSAGGTCTFDSTGRTEGIGDLQAGSYALMDSTFGGYGIPFHNALTCLSTVISVSGGAAVCDAGLKSLSIDHGNPVFVGDAQVFFLSDEHTTLITASQLRPGDRVSLIPSHVDPTVSLHSRLWAVRDEQVISEWPTVARGVW